MKASAKTPNSLWSFRFGKFELKYNTALSPCRILCHRLEMQLHAWSALPCGRVTQSAFACVQTSLKHQNLKRTRQRSYLFKVVGLRALLLSKLRGYWLICAHCLQVPGRNANGTIRRAGVPQFRQVHNLLMRGLREFETIIPGFKEALVAAGAQSLDYMKETCFVRPPPYLYTKCQPLNTLSLAP